MRTADDMRELARLSIAETIDAMQVLSRGRAAETYRSGHSVGSGEAACRQSCAGGGVASAQSKLNRESAECGRGTPACGAVGSGGNPSTLPPSFRN